MKSYKDYFLKINDGDMTYEIIVNFTKHQIKRSIERDVPNGIIWQSLQEPEIAQILDLKPQEHAIVIDCKRDISYALEVYSDYHDIIVNIITAFDSIGLFRYPGEKEIIIEADCYLALV